MNRSSFRTAIETLEGRQLMAAIKGTDISNISGPTGEKDNGQNVTVKFDAAVTAFDISKMRMFGYSNNTLIGGQVKSTINILSATTSGNNLILRTDVMIRKGSQLTFSSGGATVGGQAFAGTVKTKKGLNRDRFTLALRSFKPADKSYFSSAILPGGSAPVTANTAPTESAVRAQLSAFLDKKIKEKTITAAQKTSTLARYDDANVVAKVPAPNLRAGILSLIGTVAEPAIGFYLDKQNSTGKDFLIFDFNGAMFSSNAKISETSYTSTGRIKTVWNPNYAGESFVVLSGLIAHETVHEGQEFGSQQNSQQEEVVANVIENMVYAQQIVTDFTYAKQHTILTLRANYRELLLLNSGDKQFPRIGINDAPLVRTAAANPGFTSPDYDNRASNSGKPAFDSFNDEVRQEYAFRNIAAKASTATYPTARAILKNITGNTYTTATTYGDALIADIDVSQDTLGDAYAMRVARVLQVAVRA